VPTIRLSPQDDVYIQPESQKDEWHWIDGGEGNDRLELIHGTARGGPGNDTIVRRVLSDQPWYQVQLSFGGNGAIGFRVNLADGWAEDGEGGRDTLIGSFSGVHGTSADDWLVGDSADNFFWGNGGHDTFFGGEGTDVVGAPWYDAGGRWTQATLDDVKIVVSADGLSARIEPLIGNSFSYQLFGVEAFQAPTPDGNWSTYLLKDFLTQSILAEQTIAAGGNVRWNAQAALGSPVTVSFSFRETAPKDSDFKVSGFMSFDEEQRQEVREIFHALSLVTGLEFVEVTETLSKVGQIRFGINQQADSRGLSFTPGDSSLAGDVWLDVETAAQLAPGTEGYEALLHEIGHALGLRHPRNVDVTDRWTVEMSRDNDLKALTVMSQTPSPDGLFRADWGPLDLLALRYLYGIREAAGADSIHRLAPENRAAMSTLVDDGGVDTLDASQLPEGVWISLVPGSMSKLGTAPSGLQAQASLAIPEGTLIENVVGTEFDDVLIGNALDNRIEARRGNDRIDGGDGFDTAIFEGKRSDYRISYQYGVIGVEALDGLAGFDALVNIEQLEFADKKIGVDKVSFAANPREGEAVRIIASFENLRPNDQVDVIWSLDNQVLNGVSGWEYTPLQADVGRWLRATLIRTNGAGDQDVFVVQGSARIENRNDPPKGQVRIVGNPVQGESLRLIDEVTDADGRRLDTNGHPEAEFRWFANGERIWDATTETLVLKQAHVGKEITAGIRFQDQFGTWEETLSAGTVPVANQNDIASGSVSVIGNPSLGQILRARASVVDPDGIGPFEYQWFADEKAIVGATTSALLLGESLVAKSISVRLNFIDGFGSLESFNSQQTLPVARANLAPSGSLSLRGYFAQGETVWVIDTVTDADGVSSKAHQWYANGLPIASATSTRLILTETEVGKRITVLVKYTDGRGNTEKVVSGESLAVINLNDPVEGNLRLDGSPVEGEILRLNDNLRDADGLGPFTYFWKADGARIDGADGAAYKLTQAEVGKQISVAIEFVDGHGSLERLESPPSARVENRNDPPSGTLRLDYPPGLAQHHWINARFDPQLRDNDGLGSLLYKWYAGDALIDRATGSNLQLTQSEVGKRVTVEVSYVDGQGTLENIRSNSTPVVGDRDDPATGSIRVEGEATVGKTLRIIPEGIADPDGVGPLSYIWSVGHLAPGGFIESSSNELLLTQDYQGIRIQAEVRFVDGGGKTERIWTSQLRPVAPATNASPQGKPSIAGEPVQGAVLTVSSAGISDADGIGPITYRWYADDDMSLRGEGPNFQLSPDLAGKGVWVFAEFTDGRGVTEQVRSATTPPVRNINDPPEGSVAFRGELIQGATLEAYSSLRDADGLGLIRYQWQTEQGPIEGATTATLVLTQAQVGKRIAVVASYVDGFGTPEQVSSAAPNRVVENLNDAPVGNVLLEGELLVGKTITARALLSDLDGLGDLSWAWRADGITIAGQGADRMVISEALVGKRITATASYFDGFRFFESIESARSSPVRQYFSGSANDEKFTGSSYDDLIEGDSGDDTLLGVAGADLLEGGPGNDLLDGGDGNDTLDGVSGDDRVLIDAASANRSWGIDLSNVLDDQGNGRLRDFWGGEDQLRSVEAFWFIGGPGWNWVRGGNGNDRLEGGSGGDDLRGGPGNDTINGGAGWDNVEGGPGDDLLSAGADGGFLDYSWTTIDPRFVPTRGVDVNLAEGWAIDPWGDEDRISGFVVIRGSPYNDHLIGDLGHQNLQGGDDDDTLEGGLDSDYLDLGPGNDFGYGGPGNDTIVVGGSGDTGSDLADGGSGYDAAEYNYSGLDHAVDFRVTASSGFQEDPFGGIDTLLEIEELRVIGGKGADRLEGEDRRDVLMGGPGNDTLIGHGGNDHLEAGSGSNLIEAGSGDDFIVLGWGYDRDALNAAQGGNLSALRWNNTVDGGEGADTVQYSFWDMERAVEFSSAFVPGQSQYLQNHPFGVDFLSGVERVEINGGRGADRLRGDPGFNNIQGGGGNDTLTGGGGGDEYRYDLNMELGRDLITDFGLPGSYLRFWNGPVDRLFVNVDSATLRRGEANVTKFDANSVLFQLGRDDQPGADLEILLIGETLSLAGFVLRIDPWGTNLVHSAQVKAKGTDQNERFEGSPFDDSIDGGGGNDQIYGFEGDDSLLGGEGDDRIEADGGNDTVKAGPGNDLVLISDGRRNSGVDEIDGGEGWDSAEYNFGNEMAAVRFEVSRSNLQTNPFGGSARLTNVEVMWVHGGSGSDYFRAADGQVNFWGNAGDDTLIGGPLGDHLDGGSGSNLIEAGSGDDHLGLGWGYDRNSIDAAPGGKLSLLRWNNTVDGGEGSDAVNYSFWDMERAVEFSSAFVPGQSQYLQNHPFGVDRLSGVERVDINGGRGSDRLTGDRGSNWLQGGGGDDTLTGNGGGDTFGYDLNMDLGRDLITDFGEFGSRLWFWNGPVQKLVDVSRAATLLRGEFSINQSTEREAVFSLGRDDTAGADLEIRLRGIDLAQGQFLVNTQPGGTELRFAWNPLPSPTEGADRLQGRPGSDVLSGLGGDDTLVGDWGNDTLIGGTGNDVFLFGGAADGSDFIQDLTLGDRIVLEGLVANGSLQKPLASDLAKGDIRISLVGNETMIEIGYDSNLGTDVYVRIGAIYPASFFQLITDPVARTTTLQLKQSKLDMTVLDGYVEGALIYLDANGNGVADPSENTGLKTDARGRFSGTVLGDGALIAVGGINTDTGLANSLTLAAPSGSSVISPLTTVVHQVMKASGVDMAQAGASVNKALGLPSGVNLMQFDPLASPQDSAAMAVQKANVQVAMTAALGGEAMLGSMAGVIAKRDAGAAPLDLSDAGALAGLAPGLSAGSIQSISVANAGVKAAVSLTQLASTQKAALVAAGRAGSASDDTLIGLAGDERIDGGGGVDTVRYDKMASQYVLRINTSGITLRDKSGGEGTDTLLNVERLRFSDKTIPIETKAHGSYADLPDTLYQFFVVGFGAAAGVTYMDQMAEAYRYWKSDYKEGTVKQIVEVFTTKMQFTSVYPQALYRTEGGKYYRYDHDLSQAGKPLVKGAEVSKAVFDGQMANLAQELINLIVKESASATTKAQAVEDVKSALGLGGEWTIGKVVYTIFGNLANKPADDPNWAGTAQQFANQVAVSKYYTETLGQSTDDITTLRSVMAAVSNTSDVSSDEAIASLIGVALLNGPGSG